MLIYIKIYKGGKIILNKYLIRLGLLGTLTFLCLFFYLYKTTGKFRHSIMSAFVAATVYLSSLTPAQASEAQAFTPQNQQHHSRPQKQGIFSHESRNNDSGPGKPNDDGSDGDDGGISNYPKPESVEKTQERVHRMDEQLYRMNEVTDSDSDLESEEDQCRLESKAGFKELPDSKNFSYDMKQGTGLKKQVNQVWENPPAKKEVLRMLKRFDDPNSKIEEKALKGFKNLTELKNSESGVRIFIHRGKNKQPTVISFCMRKDLDDTIYKLKLKKKYN
jgi:hypothetical protein